MSPVLLLKKFFSRPLYPAALFSLMLHLVIVLLSGEKGLPAKFKQDKRRVEQLARINIQTVPLAPADAPPAALQVFREDLFKDTTDEEKKLFKLRKSEDPRRRITVDQTRNLRDLLMPDAGSGKPSGDTNSYVPFYSLDTLPRAVTPYEGRIVFPDQATALGITAFSVVVELLIDSKGRLLKSRLVSNGSFGFGEAVLKGLQGVRFLPGKIRGRAVRSLLRERILFHEGGR